MKTMFNLSNEINEGIDDLWKNSGGDAVCQELSLRISQLESEILTAWFAEHGFAPEKAVLVKENTKTGFKVYIREISTEESELISQKMNPKMNTEIIDLLKSLRDSAEIGVDELSDWWIDNQYEIDKILSKYE
jgi:hypothetical protein